MLSVPSPATRKPVIELLPALPAYANRPFGVVAIQHAAVSVVGTAGLTTANPVPVDA
jgi:hypothetical protein